MPPLLWLRSLWLRQAGTSVRPGSQRDRVAALFAFATAISLGSVFLLAKSTSFLMPGPLASAHGGIEKCSTCHSKSGTRKLSWVRGLVAGEPHADSKACLTCHKMPVTAFNAHGASPDILKSSTERLIKVAEGKSVPRSARAQSIAFPADDAVAAGLDCATCHQEHQGVAFKLNKISNEQCRSCHVVKFNSFDRDHPEFDKYPFKKRTQIIYDHAGHFGKHYPEVAKKDPAKRIPGTCSTCHNSNADKRVMAIVPFDKTCATCHLDQIAGKERVSGPKGIAFLSLPGLDVQSLKKKNASLGEWPDASEAALTPFMKVMISRNENGRALLKTIGSLNLQDLSNASDPQIKTVTDLVWEIKTLFYKLISGKASDALGDLNIGGGATLSPGLVADLTASIPRDVLISAQQQWLPNLAAEMANRPNASAEGHSGWSAETTESHSPGSLSGAPLPQTGAQAVRSEDAAGISDAANAGANNDTENPSAKSSSSDELEAPGKSSGNEAHTIDKRDPPPCVVRVLGQCLVFKDQKGEVSPGRPVDSTAESDTANAEPGNGKARSSAGKLPPAMRAGLNGIESVAEVEGSESKTRAPNDIAGGGKQMIVAGNQPQSKAMDQSDDLLSPTEEELREMNARKTGGSNASESQGTAGQTDAANAKARGDATVEGDASAGTPANAAANPQPSALPVISIESDVDPESWAEYGGWYRQDYAIFYRPTGHKDKFIYSWLFLTGPLALKTEPSPAAAVFDYLTSKDAQGSCTKCHSVDDIQNKGRLVNFAPLSIESKKAHFTTFIHEPHFGTMDDRGCLTCHSLEKGSQYLKSYEQGNPQSFASNFGAVKKELCQTCHTASKARQDCLTCHKYHLNEVVTPIINTKLPMP